MITQRFLAYLCIAFLFGCATAVSTTSDPNKKLSEAREMLKSGQSLAAETMLREAMDDFAERNDYRGLGESQMEYANFLKSNARAGMETGSADTVRSYFADAASSFERALPPLVSLQDYQSASKVYFLLATARNNLNDSAEACTALSLSLHYYGEALAKDSSGSFTEMASDINDDSDGMEEVRSKFGCARTRSNSMNVRTGAEAGGTAFARNHVADAASSVEKTLPFLVSSQDYQSASKAYFLLANARNDLGDSAEACAALSLSLHYYRKALAKNSDASFPEAASDINDDSDGMAVVRSKFGCGSTQSNSLPA
jgi:tetratricopeptide (TPR) repeat protein